MNGLATEQTAYYATLILTTGVLIASLEDLASVGIFAGGGLLNWDVLALQNRHTASSWTGWLGARLFGLRGMTFTVAFRVVAALLLMVGSWDRKTTAVFLGVTYLGLLSLNLRSPYGLDGAHQMYRFCFGGLFLFQLVTPNTIATRSCLYFIGMQSVFSYLVSGANKLVSPSWRSGAAMTGIFSASLYGNRRLFEILNKRPLVAGLLSWGVILFECSMIFAPFVGDRYCLVFLGMGFLFHISNAILMGLNGFLFAFVGTYPPIFLLAHNLQHGIRAL